MTPHARGRGARRLAPAHRPDLPLREACRAHELVERGDVIGKVILEPASERTEWMMDLGDHLAVPYVAIVYSVERPDGTWWRRAEYPELPGCAAEAPSAVEAMELLERQRVRLIAAAYARCEEIPAPRPPLPGVSGLSGQSLAEVLREAANVSAAGPGHT
jgi:predicted RNase H-like HicB family nuclease